jgi:hypothetical protein
MNPLGACPDEWIVREARLGGHTLQPKWSSHDHDEEIGDLIESMNGIFKGHDARVVSLPIVAVLDDVVIQVSPSAEQALSMVRTFSREMQSRIRANWASRDATRSTN